MEKAGWDSGNRINLPDDLIRTLAIFLVILLHASNEILQAPSVPQEYWWTAVAYKSVSLVCVPLFVMLSGALLLQPAKLNEPIRVFLKKRLSRIGLAFAFWSAVYLAWGFFLTNTPVTLGNIGKGILYDLFSGANYQFWFIYLIVGLYLITPILRVIIAYGSDRILRYLLLLWFVGIAIVPILQLASGLTLDHHSLCYRRLDRLLCFRHIPAAHKSACFHPVWVITCRICHNNLWSLANDLPINRCGAKQLLFRLPNRQRNLGVSCPIHDSHEVPRGLAGKQP